MLYRKKEYKNIYLEPICYSVDLMSYLTNLNKTVFNDEIINELIDSEIKMATDNLKDYSRFLSLIFKKDYEESFNLFFKGEYQELLSDEFILDESLDNMLSNCIKPINRLSSLMTLIFDLLGVELYLEDLVKISNLDTNEQVDIILNRINEETKQDLSEQRDLFMIIANMNYHIYLLKEEIKRLYGEDSLDNLDKNYPISVSLSKDMMLDSFYGLYLSYYSLIETAKTVYKGMTNNEYPTKPNMHTDDGLVTNEILGQLSFYSEIEKALKALDKYENFIAYIYKLDKDELSKETTDDFMKIPSIFQTITISTTKTKTLIDAKYIHDNIFKVWHDMSSLIGALEGYFKVPSRSICAPMTYNRGDKIIKAASKINDRLTKIFEKEFRVIAQTLDNIYSSLRIIDTIYGNEPGSAFMASINEEEDKYLHNIKYYYLVIKRD